MPDHGGGQEGDDNVERDIDGLGMWLVGDSTMDCKGTHPI